MHERLTEQQMAQIARSSGRPKVQQCRAQQQQDKQTNGKAKAAATAAAATASSLLLVPVTSVAADSATLSTFSASGVVFKDSVSVERVADPDVPSVQLYLTDFKRSLPSKLNKGLFTEPSQASLSCALTANVDVSSLPKKVLNTGDEGAEIYSEKKGGGLVPSKVLRVRRLFDSSNKERSEFHEEYDCVFALSLLFVSTENSFRFIQHIIVLSVLVKQIFVYVAYSTRLSSDEGKDNASPGRYSTSSCALPLAPSPSAAPKKQDQVHEQNLGSISS